tara:strand:- start:194 stop:1099 length:906 start_codon:yes stop_codon:yes gene_type:complete
MIEIVIWISPTDIDDLEKSLNRLDIGKDYLTKEQCDNIKFNIIMGVSDEIIDWGKGSVTIEECTDKFLGLKYLTDWASNGTFETTTTINGCTSMRRFASYSDSKYYLWLDTDIIFDPKTLVHLINSINVIEYAGFTKFVSIPEIVRQWDSTWDCLVNERFINKPIGYQATNNPHIDASIYGDPQLEEVRNNVPNQPYMKFGGGWFALISKELMKVIPFPENYGHYGLDDTYLMWGANILQDPTIKQFKLKNIVVCENYFNRITTYKGQIQFIDKRQEYKKYNEELFFIGLQTILNNKKISQ